MAKNRQTYTLQIDAELGNLESKLASVKSLLSGVLSSANAPKGLDKSLGKLGELIDKIRVIGNAAVTGASMLLLNRSLRSETAKFVSEVTVMELSGNPLFADEYMERMMFE